MTNEEIIKRLESIASAELVCDRLKVGAITKECFESIQKTARLAISALERDRWISVEERLPEKYGEYMILWKPKSYRTKTLFYEITEYEDGEWIGEIPQSKPYGGYEVFYWCELPEPPKEEA